MSHDRGCSCGREPYEYEDCTDETCPQTYVVNFQWAGPLPRGVQKSKDDKISSPKHYASTAVQPIELIMESDPDGKFCKGNIIKYAHRAGTKVYDGMTPVQSEITDLHKVQQYAEFRIRQLSGLPIIENK